MNAFSIESLLLAAAFGFTFFGVLALGRLLPGTRSERRLRRLVRAEGGPAAAAGHSDWKVHVEAVARSVASLAAPEEGWQDSKLRKRLMQAGLRDPMTSVLYFAAKTAGTVGLPLGFVLASRLFFSGMPWDLWAFALVAMAALGYYAPEVALHVMTRRRKREIFEAVPDALDLLIVCVEAGLAIDAALSRVAQEIHLRSAALAEELHLATLEIRAGATREKALRNLALRTGVEDIDALVAMLVQADRFGTSVADALRVHGDMMRVKRRQLAEEKAQKLPVKLLFPLIFCIFPALLLVLLGPAIIQIYRILLPTMAGN